MVRNEGVSSAIFEYLSRQKQLKINILISFSFFISKMQQRLSLNEVKDTKWVLCMYNELYEIFFLWNLSVFYLQFWTNKR